MVYIFGGGFRKGDARLYNPEYFMDKDIVLVTLNYRLGPLGKLIIKLLKLPKKFTKTAALRPKSSQNHEFEQLFFF